MEIWENGKNGTDEINWETGGHTRPVKRGSITRFFLGGCMVFIQVTAADPGVLRRWYILILLRLHRVSGRLVHGGW